jgi:dolichyl-phosphate-mannose--protein O-mannosyl transferase
LKATANARIPERSNSVAWILAALVAGGLVLRLVLVPNDGFQTDISTFEFWAISLAEHGFANFYSNAGFADYPPGYFYVLALLGHVWETFFKTGDSGHYTVLKLLVKLPAIVADACVGVLLYAVARRFASTGWALGAAALYLLNPAVIYNSAAWGQVDSVAAGLALLAIYCLLRSDDDAPDRISWWTVAAWPVIAYSLLIKPQAAVVLPIMLAFAFVDPARRRSRVIASAIGIAAGLVLAVALTEPFHPSNPVEALTWLFGRYQYGSNVYPFNTVNAFNLWAIRGPFWQQDTTPITVFGGLSLGPQYLWGLILLVAALGLVVWRYVQAKTSRALLESCAIATLAFFVLSTRMHERYSFDGLLFTIACIPFAARYMWGAVALTVVLFANLQYSLQYLNVMQNHIAGADAQNLWGPGTTVFALLAVGTFFWLGYQFLGGENPSVVAPDIGKAPVERDAGSEPIGRTRARRWFDPGEGLTGMRAPIDYIVMGALGLVSFVLSFVNYWYPADKVFDEIYFARAGEEYLQNLRIYENTHPPLTKLLVTLSMMLFGGMPHGHGVGGWTFLNGLLGHMSSGDNSYGWRFLDVVFGALVVMLLYIFAKRVTGSTVFAGIAALLLTCDGMHFVQSRIATPEGFVIFFATLATYAFYRFWLASQVSERRHVPVPQWAFAAAAGASFVAGLIVAFLGHIIFAFDTASTVLVTLYIACAAYLAIRFFALERKFGAGREQTFADGSYALTDKGETVVYAPDGGTIDDRGKIVRGARSSNRGGVLTYDDDELRIEYRRDPSVRYATPAGAATYANDAISAQTGTESGRASTLWLVLFTVALGCLVSSKWYGVMGFGVSFLVLIAVAMQGLVWQRRPLLWGNPRGFRLDAALVTIVLISATVYALVWLPDLARHSPDPNEVHSLNDVVYRQYSMFEYHDKLVATHPYSSKWFEWPLDYVPVAYFYEDKRHDQQNPKGCCIEEITSMPNPMILWFGLICVPFVAVLAWRERNKAYALIVLTYLLQWLPWIKSPRITFAYHFYVDIPLICLCNAIVLQRIWQWGLKRPEEHDKWLGGAAVAAYVTIVVGAFIYFYPILSAHGIAWNQWNQRMWIGKWIIGPG